MSMRMRSNVRWLILVTAALLIFVGSIAQAEEICGTAVKVPAKTPTAAPYDHCIVEGADGAGTPIEEMFKVRPEGDIVRDLTGIFGGLTYPIVFSATCYDAFDNPGLPAEPSGRCTAPGQPEIIIKITVEVETL